jgi:predicted amidohydrolase YtcJ
VILTHASGHGSFVNAAAMARANITKATPDPAGGEIMKDANGNPIGFMNERAQGLVRTAMDRDRSRRTALEREAEAERQIDLAAQECISKGLTSFQDAGSGTDVIDRLKKRATAGTLPLRLWVMIRESNDRLARDLPKYRTIGFGDDHVTVRSRIAGGVAARAILRSTILQRARHRGSC